MKTMKTLITIIRSVVALAGVAGRNLLSVQFMKTNLGKAKIKTRNDPSSVAVRLRRVDREPISNED